MMNCSLNALKPSLPAPQFGGRFKTVKEKHVKYDNSDLETFSGDMGPGSSIVSGIGGGLTALSIGQPSAIALPVAGLVGPWVIGLPLAALSGRTVKWTEKQIAMTPEEEWAVMTPVEKATSQVDKALKTWDEVRKKQEGRINQIDKMYQSLEKELTTLQQEQATLEKQLHRAEKLPVEQQAQVLEGESLLGFRRKLDHLALRCNAKQKVFQEQQTLLDAAKKVYQALDEEIKQREQTLYETRETLQVMDQRGYVLEMHQQLQTVKGTSPDEKKPEEVSMGNMALEVEKQRVQLEVLMESIQTAMDVDSVLNKVSQTPK